MTTIRLPQGRPPRFLIARRSAIGDCIVTLPLVCALRDAFPQAHITWAMERAPHRLLAGHPAVNEFLVVEKGFPKWRDFLALRSRLRAGRYDVALDPQSLTKSAALAWFSGARQRIGFRAPLGREISIWLNNHLVAHRRTHVVERQLELLEPLGVPFPAQPRFGLHLDAEDEATIAAWRREQGLPDKYSVLNAGAAWECKLWPAERYGHTARWLQQSLGLTSVALWGSAREKGWAEQIVAESAGAAVLAPSTTLKEMAALIRPAALFVGSDTGPLHLAAALGVRCVGLFGATRGEVTGPYGQRFVQAFVQQIPNGQKMTASNDAMRAITVPAVCIACEAALADETIQPQAA